MDKQDAQEEPTLLESRLACHLAYLREDATDPELSSLERLALVRDRGVRAREIRVALESRKQHGRRVGPKAGPGERPRGSEAH